MIFLLLAILSSAMVSIVMRISSDKISANLSMLAVNYLLCSVLGAAYAGFQIWLPEASGFSLTLGLGVLSGILYLAGFAMLQLNVRKNGVVLSSIFMKLGLLVPIVLSLLFFNEIPTAAQIVGFCIAIGAIIVINVKKDSSAGGFSIGLIVLLLLGGSCDAMSKVYEVFGAAELSEQFLFYTFLTAFLLCTAVVLIQKEHLGRWEVFFGVLIGIPNFFSARFLLASLTQLDAVIVYPTYSVATILAVTLAGVAVFRERLHRRQWYALAAILAALVMLNS